jgi:hypothetical protein
VEKEKIARLAGPVLPDLFRIWASRYSLRKNSILVLLLGGAAVYRCDKHLIFSAGFSR